MSSVKPFDLMMGKIIGAGLVGLTQVLAWIDGISRRPTRKLFDIEGKPVVDATLDALMQDLDRDAVPERQSQRHALVVHRSALRSMPTSLRVFSEAGNTDIDRFQESALFPGTPVLIVHRSRDRQWLFVVSERYAAWVEASAIASRAARSWPRLKATGRLS